MATAALNIALEIIANPKVQDTAVKAFDAVYSRIFKNRVLPELPSAIDVKPMSSEQKMIVDRLTDIDSQLANMPSDVEMAMAFSALQADLRAGQKRLLIVIAPIFVLNFILLSWILYKLYTSS